MNETIPVYMTDDQAFDFVEYCKNRDLFKLLQQHNVFDLRAGSCEIHFDLQGKVKTIDVHSHIRI